MGQYGNQPDFGTRALTIEPQGTPGVDLQDLKQAALYIGTGGTLVCVVAGATDTGANINGITVFKNIPDGTFFPVIVNNVLTDNEDGEVTTCANIIALY